MKEIIIDGNLRERFWSKVDKRGDDECWEWTAGTNFDGYGQIGLSNSGGLVRSHRVSWTIYHGPVPGGMSVLHLCDNPGCVNPAHLFLGTQSDNVADMVSKGRGYDKSGMANPNVILSDADVSDIASLLTGDTPSVEIAKQFNVNEYVISQINRGKNWSWLTGATKTSPIRRLAFRRLSTEEVGFIKHWIDCGYKQTYIADAFGVSTATISEIKTGRTWSNA